VPAARLFLKEVVVLRQFTNSFSVFKIYPVLISIGAVTLLSTLGQAVFILILPLYLKETLGFTASFIGVALGAYAVSETLVKTPLGFISDRVGRKAIIVFGIFLCLLVPVPITLLHHPVQLILLQIVNGAGVAAFWPVLAALTADVVPVENRSQAMTVFNLAYLVALSLGPALGAFANHAAGNNAAAFYVAAFFLAAAAVTATAAIPGSRRAGPPARETRAPTVKKEVTGYIKLLAGRPVLMAMLFISLLQQFGTGLLAPVFVLFAKEQLGFTQADIGRVLILPAVAVALLAMPFGRLADVAGKARAVRCAYAAAAPAIYLLTAAGGFAVWQVLISVVGLAYVTGAPAWTALASMAAPQGRGGGTIAAVGTMHSLGFILGPGVGGLLYDRVAPAAPFYGCSTILLVCMVLVGLLVSEETIVAEKTAADGRGTDTRTDEHRHPGKKSAAGE
jgi:MFS family permease